METKQGDIKNSKLRLIKEIEMFAWNLERVNSTLINFNVCTFKSKNTAIKYLLLTQKLLLNSNAVIRKQGIKKLA